MERVTTLDVVDTVADAGALLDWRGHRTTSRAFDRWLRSGSYASRWEKCPRLDWLLWLRALRLGERVPELELLEFVGPLLVAALEAADVRSPATDRVLELLSDERAAEAHAKVFALPGPAVSLLSPLTDLAGTEAEEIDFNQPRELVTPAWVEAAREAFRLVWLRDAAQASALHDDALAGVRSAGAPEAPPASRSLDPERLDDILATAISEGTSRRALVAAMTDATQRAGLDRAPGGELVMHTVAAAARWARGEASPWEVLEAHESALAGRSDESGFWGFSAWPISTFAALSVRGWERWDHLLDWAEALEGMTHPRKSDGWLRRLGAPRRRREVRRALRESIDASNATGSDDEEPIPLLDWLAEVSSDAQAYFDPNRVELPAAWASCHNPTWMVGLASIAIVDEEIVHGALKTIVRDLLMKLDIADRASGLAEAVRVEAQSAARQASAVARAPSSWTEVRLPEPLIILSESQAGDDEREFLLLAAEHHALAAAAHLADGRALASIGSMDRAAVAEARAAGADRIIGRQSLCLTMAREIPWEVIASASASLPSIKKPGAMAFAGVAELLPRMLR